MDQLRVIWFRLLVALMIQTASIAQKLSSFSFPTFNSTEKLLINRDAEYMPNSSSIWLNPKYNGSTNGLFYSCGEIIYAESIQMRSSGGLVVSFNTSFTFSIAGQNSAGMAFMFAVENYTTGGAGASLCLLLKPQNGRATNHLFAVEFDTWQNPEFNDPSDNHVGVNVNSMNSTAVYNACGSLTSSCSYFDVDKDFTAWIEYDSTAQTVAVFLTKGSLVQNVSKPATPIILAPHIDLTTVFNDYMYVGFTGSSAMFPEIKKIKSWSFRTGIFEAGDPEQGSGKRSSNSVEVIAGVVSGVCGLIAAILCCAYLVLRRRGVINGGDPGAECEALSVEFSSSVADHIAKEETKNVQVLWPREFSFQELNVATNGFSEGSLLGEGGYGQVFKGIISTSAYQYVVAVKRTRMKESNRASARDFLAELSVISQIRHRNLVRLYGWCQENNNLLLVLEYMPNSSLERWLFDCKQNESRKLLTWPQRQHIMTGVAAALAYLHEGWSQCILHRDIKAANVLLDECFNPHVGDFGLARIINHNKLGRTTAVAGTFGYLAPETAQEGKVTQKSDVYSFGILALEVASGRPVLHMDVIDEDGQEDVEVVNLLGCVWHAHEKGKLLSVVDPKLLGSEFDQEQVKLMFQLGLLCCHPDPDARPLMRVVHRCMVDGEVAQLVATLPPSKPRVQYYVGGRVQASSGNANQSHDSAGAQSSMNSQESSSGLTWSSVGSVNQLSR